MSSELQPDKPAIERLVELSGLILSAVEAVRSVDREGRAAARLAVIAAEAAAIRERLQARSGPFRSETG